MFLVILLINILLLFVGMFMETIAALIILSVPLLAQGLASIRYISRPSRC